MGRDYAAAKDAEVGIMENDLLKWEVGKKEGGGQRV